MYTVFSGRGKNVVTKYPDCLQAYGLGGLLHA